MLIQILIETQHGADVYGLVALASKHPSVYFCSIVAVQECIHEFVQFFFVCVTRDGRTRAHAWVTPPRKHNVFTTFLCGVVVA